MALKFEYLTVDTLAHWLAVANTSNYLYRHFREENGMAKFAGDAKTTELFEYIREVVSAEQRSFGQRVLAYAALVALTYKPIPEIDAWLQNNILPPLKWAPEILADYRASVVNVQVFQRNWNSKAKIVENGKPASVSTTLHQITLATTPRQQRSTLISTASTAVTTRKVED